jgi:hypothetical protein
LSLVDFGKDYKNIVAPQPLNATNILEGCKIVIEQLGYLRRQGLRKLCRDVVSNMSRNKVNKNFIFTYEILLQIKDRSVENKKDKQNEESNSYFCKYFLMKEMRDKWSKCLVAIKPFSHYLYI